VPGRCRGRYSSECAIKKMEGYKGKFKNWKEIREKIVLFSEINEF
jgi:hypothetical protein